MTRFRSEKLRSDHRIAEFDCGQEDLNRFLTRYALQNTRAGASQTYVTLANDDVIGYYTLVVGQIEYNDAAERLTKGLARHPVPVMLLGRLAIATAWQGQGVGAALLKDAMLRTLQAADIAGIRAFTVHAKDDNAKAFYEHFDFTALPNAPYHLFRLIKDIRSAASPLES